MEFMECKTDRIRGCMFGGAVGDALGAPIEFLGEDAIYRKYGERGITAFDKDKSSGRALISDDTQMSLFTAVGLLVGDTRGRVRGLQAYPRYYVRDAYLDWLLTQISTITEVNKHDRYTREGGRSWLLDVPELYNRRAPGNTCLSALIEERDRKKDIEDYVKAKRNNSKGCGGIMRVAPIALDYQMEDIKRLDMEAAQIAAITHGHSLGYMPAAVLVHIINRLVYPPAGRRMSLKDIVLEAKHTVSGIFKKDKNLPMMNELIDRAIDLAEHGPDDDLANIHELGEGWVAEETLAIALYCSLRYQDDFTAGLISSVNHKGDSDSTGAVTGNILGALTGYSAIQDRWKGSLELENVILEVADDLDQGCPLSEFGCEKDRDGKSWETKYIYMRRAANRFGESQCNTADRKQEKSIKGENMNGSIRIQKISITDIETDAIVNAANSGLQAGGGVCGAIFREAGYSKLQAACDQIGHCDTGHAVITPGFGTKAKYIIHAVGPIWYDGHHHEPQLLYSAYQSALKLALENGCSSIAFPLISAGIYGYPRQDAWRKAIQACRDFLEKNKGADLKVVFAVLDSDALQEGERILRDQAPDFIDDHAEQSGDTLVVNGRKVSAVYFHLKDEPDGYLSNWYRAEFDLEGIHFTSTEQYIMYKKCKLFGEEGAAKQVLATDEPKQQQAIGQAAKGYNRFLWEGSRQIIAVKGLMAKFSQNDDLRQKLLSTGDSWLVECAGSDHIWACGIRPNDDRRRDTSNWTGTNILGFALMAVRDSLCPKA